MKPYLKIFPAAAKQVLNLVLPPRCAQTGEIVPAPGVLSSQAWAQLNFIAPPFCACCGMPFSIVESEPVSQDSDLLCGPCVTQQPPYRQNRSALVYDDSSRSLILAFKHGDKTHLTVTLAPLLARCGAEILGKADFLIPVPLHWRRLITRRYNQAGLLAHALGKLTGIPVLPDVLLRKRHTPPQGHKNARDRHANVKNAFMLNPIGADSIKGKTCVLIDDVFTTGATLEECTQVLVDSGAREVNLLTLARVVKSV